MMEFAKAQDTIRDARRASIEARRASISAMAEAVDLVEAALSPDSLL
jgi:hypothetical protein